MGYITPNEELADPESMLHGFERGLFNMSDTALWDVSTLDDTPYRLFTFGASYELGIFASLEGTEGDSASELSATLEIDYQEDS